MVKKLNKAYIADATIRNASVKTISQAFEGTPLGEDSVSVDEYEWTIDQEVVDEIENFIPPQSKEEWEKATEVESVFSSRVKYIAKDRGDTLKEVDAAYKSWIDGDITNGQNAENLLSALEKYRGPVYAMRKFGSSPGHLSNGKGLFKFQGVDYRDDRNKDGIMDKVHNMVKFIKISSPSTFKNNDKHNIVVRHLILLLMGNIDVKLQYTDFLGDIGGMSSESVELLKDKYGEIAQTIAAEVAGGGAALYVGWKTNGVADEEQFVNSLPDDTGTIGKYARAFFKTLVNLFEKFLDWVGKKWTSVMDKDAGKIVGIIGTILKIIFKYTLEAAKKVIGGANDIATGVAELCQDGWTHRQLDLQEDSLVTVDGAFALIRSGVKKGIQIRLALSSWKCVKGSISTAVNVMAAGSGKIADLILAGLEFAMKFGYALYQNSKIQSFLSEAKILCKRLVADTDITRSRRDMISASASDVKPADPAFMPDFKAASYTTQEYLNDTGGCYLNFLYSCVKSSPVMAYIIMNSGIVSYKDVFHAATPRSTSDEVTALDHIRDLAAECAKAYTNYCFKVEPVPIPKITGGNKKLFESMLNNAVAAKRPIPVIA